MRYLSLYRQKAAPPFTLLIIAIFTRFSWRSWPSGRPSFAWWSWRPRLSRFPWLSRLPRRPRWAGWSWRPRQVTARGLGIISLQLLTFVSLLHFCVGSHPWNWWSQWSVKTSFNTEQEQWKKKREIRKLKQGYWVYIVAILVEVSGQTFETWAKQASFR